MRKGQTALEYLMTYGWAILIVIIAIGALYALGLTKPCRWVGTQVTGFTEGGFEVSTPRFDASDETLAFDLKRQGASTVTFGNVSAVYKGSSNNTDPADFTMTTGDSRALTLGGVALWSPDISLSSGDCYSTDVSINYTDAGRQFVAGGKISGTIQP